MRDMTNPPARTSARVSFVAAVLAAGVSLTIAGCTPQTPTPQATATSTAGSGSTEQASPEPTLVPDGTAEQNRPFFDKVNRATLAANPEAKGRDFIDGLVAAGFAKADMQVTVDTTTIGLDANSIQFSVRLGETCLIGQNGADAGGYNSMVTPVLATGTCLVGETRSIDW